MPEADQAHIGGGRQSLLQADRELEEAGAREVEGLIRGWGIVGAPVGR